VDPARYDVDRTDMVRFIPSDARRILDVGCAGGRFAAEARNVLEDCEIWGIDPTPGIDPDPHDRRIHGIYPDALEQDTTFDCIVFNDVLEHMVDPWGVLLRTHAFLAPGGVVVASIPNVRNFVHVVRPLAINGRWRYADTGILDRTHLRFFTRASIVEMFEDARFDMITVEPIHPHDRGRWAALNRALGHRLDEVLALQYAVVARPQ